MPNKSTISLLWLGLAFLGLSASSYGQGESIRIANIPLAMQQNDHFRPEYTISMRGEEASAKSSTLDICVVANGVVKFQATGLCTLTAQLKGVPDGMPQSFLVVDKICSAVVVNGDCTIPVDREKAFAPPAIQARSGATITIAVFNPRPFDNVSITSQGTKLISPPDVSQAIEQALLPSVSKTGGNLELKAIFPSAIPDISNRLASLEAGQKDLSSDMKELNGDLKDVNALLKEVQGPPPTSKVPKYSEIHANPWDPKDFKMWRATILCELAGDAYDDAAPRCPEGGLIGTQKAQLWAVQLKSYDAEIEALSKLINQAPPCPLTGIRRTITFDSKTSRPTKRYLIRVSNLSRAN